MRKLILLVSLFSPLALAQSISVEPHSLLRLPGKAGSVTLERLDVADYGTLLIPASLTEINVGQLRLGHEARIAIVPGEQPLRVQARQAELASGSQITVRGAPGTYQKPALPGRNLELSVESLKAEVLSIDARGGAGAPGYAGLDGANGKAAGCTWGQAGRGADGDNGGNGHDGAAGANVRLQLPRNYPAARVKVRVEGGQGGEAGVAGKAGAGGKGKGCLIYRADGATAGKPGEPGQPGAMGAAGTVALQHF
ncbi:collagen-like protein [Pseudomonas sp. R5(2019)]|uniref:collagen-like protein n=1 Tax=Pseudomonas sp. R5(2019) TaxID=2697566 RepID=UPI0014130A9C|nr:collagen-like protein [Pseudomonas sp. R5(2019)]NBA94601.1 collagen-like protein [Pseudomonas sp. R5(2019)]